MAESDEHEPGLILDYDEVGDLLSIEVLDATGRIPPYLSRQLRERDVVEVARGE